MWNLNIWILVTIFTCTNGYDLKCPHSSHWNFTSACTKKKIYICLLNAIKSNGSKAVFTESCSPEDLARDGFKYILSPDLQQVPCAASRYQPFFFTTDGNSKCVFGKSLCKSSGQILANNGNSSIDASCRCDYRQNYDYVIPPKDPCSCKPAEEDCSCYIRKCEDDKVMIADYRCMKNVETILPENIKCPLISRIVPPRETSTVYNIQLQLVTGSSTWSNQASVILIVVVIILAVLIGILFLSVPHVTSILLKSEFGLSVKSKENEFLILNGDNVIIECNVKSYIRVCSVSWQKEINGEIIQITLSKEKIENKTSLTIDNFNAEDQGKYRCIVRNAFGLRNELFSCCMNYMSNVGWLTRFVKVLQHIPAFHTKDITLNTYDIDSQSKPTVYNVFKGEDITMEPHFDDQHKLVTVKWFNENDKRTELDLSKEQYSGGVPDCPSLTIKDTRMENAGKYFCLIMYDNGETLKALIKLKIIPQVKIYKAVLNHREDKTFIRPAVCDTIDKQMKTNNIAVITGREGTGKSKICLEFASIYDENEKDYMVFKVDLSENNTIYRDMVDTLLIIDDQKYTQDSLHAFLEPLLPVLSKRNIKVILTCRNVDLEIVRRVPEINKLKEEVFIDIDSCLTAEEKEEILRSYMKVHDVTSSSSAESNFRNLEIITDLSVHVTLDENAIKVIRNEEPWKGFPLSAMLFCSERMFLHLGEKYFTNPPRYLFEELKELYRTARKNSNFLDIVNEYCILVYIMDNSNHQLDLNDPDLCRKLVELYLTVFQFKYIPEKPGSNEDQKIAIEKAVHSMNNKYLKIHEGVFKFSHPCLSKAMFLSSDYMVLYLLQKGSLSDITEFVRSEHYTVLENELVIKIDKNHHQILCESLVKHAFKNHLLLQHVGQYVNEHWLKADCDLVSMMFKHIEFTLFKSLGVHTSELPSLEDDSLSEKSFISINLEDPVKFSYIIILVDELTFKGRDSSVFRPSTEDFIILSAWVSAAMAKYAINRHETFEILLNEILKRRHSESFVKLWSEHLDIHGNTFFHYLMLFNEKEACNVLYLYETNKYVLNTENVKKYTPLDIAAFLGKKNILNVPDIKTTSSKKLRYRLKRLAECGKDAFYNENTVKKKEEKSENKKSFFKRKEEPKDKHDKRDVLCFEDFIINIVVYGKIEDYESIIELL